MAGVKVRRVHLHVMVILCDSIWHVTLRSSVMGSHKELIHSVPFLPYKLVSQ